MRCIGISIKYIQVTQGSKGIRLGDKPMYNTNDKTKNYLFCTLQLQVETFEHLINQPIKIR